MEYFYFHNCLYEGVWKNNLRRHSDQIPTFDVLHKYGPDYKVIFVGDASMSPHEILLSGGAIEHFNPEPGSLWLTRITETYPHVAWLNPVPKTYWPQTQSIGIIDRLMKQRMFPLTLEGLEMAIRALIR